MNQLGAVEKRIYRSRLDSPLILPQIDPEKNDLKRAKTWFEEVEKLGLKTIVVGSSLLSDGSHMQKLMNLAITEFGFDILLYLHNIAGGIKGQSGKTAVYWSHVPNSLNTFFGWDGLISNSLNISKNAFETIPTAYVFDSRGSIGAANWLTRSNPVPREKPEISLAIAKAAEYSGIRFYIMAGGSGSIMPPPTEHIEKLSSQTSLFIIPTSGVNKPEHAKELFSAGADAIHIGNLLEKENGFRVLKEIVEISKQYSGKKFL